MASYTSLLLGVILCATTAHSLKCFTCLLGSDNCLTVTTCNSNETSCMTTSESGTFGVISSSSTFKSCTTFCATTTYSTSGITVTTSCCSTDLCNSSTSTKPGCAAIILALGAILTILRSSAL
ncbi:lymphocyte antigen 6E-like [Engystomops pustulosus]|uniref:lymphocyte antigen 6E-like n=1 Tax=Engystomops pustulosus TaxID=76066 RepID=UPI003AFA0AB4